MKEHDRQSRWHSLWAFPQILFGEDVHRTHPTGIHWHEELIPQSPDLKLPALSSSFRYLFLAILGRYYDFSASKLMNGSIPIRYPFEFPH